MNPSPPSLSQIGRGVATGLFIALVVAIVANPPAHSQLLRVLELVALVVLGFIALATIVEVVISRLAGWQDSETEFELKVRHTEELAAADLAWDPMESELLALDPLIDADFEELVRDALDDLPDLLQNALAHVAVVISSGGRRAGLYGLYQGGGVARSDVAARIVIYRDSLRRDFGHDPDALREQVTRTVRHELAHHVGFDELGVRELGL
jgi:predicted Zn-dependent protease with MMP-like domain